MTSHLKARTYLSDRLIGKMRQASHPYPSWMMARWDEAREIKERLLEVRRRAMDGRLLIVADARAVLREFYSREVELSPGIGWTFPCREDGSLLVAENEAFLKVALSTPGAVDQGISRHQFTDHLPAVGECACRTRLVVSTTYNMCRGCGRTYDLQGLEIIEADDSF